MFENLRPSLKGFVEEALAAVGADWEENPDGTTSALLPGEADLKDLTFEPEVAREDRGVELIARGSLFLDALVDLGLRGGRLARAFASPFLRPPQGLARAYSLEAERLTRSEWFERPGTTWVFGFGIGITGEFRREEMFLCAVDGASLRLVRRFEEPFSRLALVDTGPEPSNEHPFDRCYAAAREEALRRAATRFKAARTEAAEEVKKDLTRLSAYYDGLLEEMTVDEQRAAVEDARKSAILSRMEAVKADRARAAAQVEERRRISLEVEAIGAVGVVYPRLAATVALRDAKGRGSDFEIAWDPVLERFEPVLCPACRRPTYALSLRGGAPSCGCPA